MWAQIELILVLVIYINPSENQMTQGKRGGRGKVSVMELTCVAAFSLSVRLS
jgi:hypothetical protein